LPKKKKRKRRRSSSQIVSRKEQVKKSRKRAIRRNKKYIENYKLKNPCSCGEIEPCCLSFHHNNGNKTDNISNMVNKGYSIKRIRLEISKCEIKCLNCHARLHNGHGRKEFYFAFTYL